MSNNLFLTDEDKIRKIIIKTMDEVSNHALSLTGNPIDYNIEDGHDPQILTSKARRVYMFFCRGEANKDMAKSFNYDASKDYVALKIGKAGKNSDSRCFSQHYIADTRGSSLAKSMDKDEKMKDTVTKAGGGYGQWIRNYTFHINVVLKDSCPEFAMELTESIFHFLFLPIYEANRG